MMNAEPSSNRPAIIPIFILFGSFSLLLLVLFATNVSPTLRITPQNIHLLHETLRLNSGQSTNGTPPYGFALNSDNTMLLVTSSYGNEIWRLKDGTKQVMSLLNAGGSTSLVYFDGEQPMANFGNWTGSNSFLKLDTGENLQRFDGLYPGSLYSDWNISPDHRWFVVSRNESVLSSSGIKTGEVRFSVPAPAGFIFRHINPTFSNDGKLLATSLIHDSPFSFEIFVWDAVTGKLIKDVGAFEKGTVISSVDALAFSHDGKILAVGGGVYGEVSKNSVIQLWDLESGTKLAVWYGGGLSVQRLSFTPDDQILLASGYGDVWLWNIQYALKTNQPYLHLADDGNAPDYDSASLSHDGTLLAVSTPRNDILIYEVKTAALLSRLSGHHSYITQLSFSDDDQFLVSSSYDYTVRFWSVRKTNPYPALTSPQIDVAVPAPIMTPTVPG